MRLKLFFSALFLSLSIVGLSQETLISKGLLLNDFQLIKTALEESHPALYKFTSKQSMDSIFLATELKINRDMSEREFFIVLGPMISAVKCGHTRYRPSKEFLKTFSESGKVFPFDIKISEDRIFVLRNYSADSTIVPGTEITLINGLSASVILSELYELFSADGNNLTKKYRGVEGGFDIFYYLLKGEQKEFRIAVKRGNSVINSELIVSSITRKEKKALKQKLNLNEQGTYLSILNKSTASLVVKSFDSNQLNRQLGDYEHWVDSVFVVLQKSKINNLIIDLRGNEGGYSMNAFYLFSYIATSHFAMLNPAVFKTDKKLSYFGDEDISDWYEFKPDGENRFIWSNDDSGWLGTGTPKVNAFTGNICVLTDGGTFSSGGFFTALVRYYKRGIVVGEESGGNLVCNDSHGTLNLPNSHLEVHIARATWGLNLPGYEYSGRGIVPDKELSTSMENLIKGNDEVLFQAIEIIQSMKR